MKFRELFGMWNRPSLVFEEGPNASDPNNPNASGGDDDSNAGGGGGAPPKDQSFDLTVGGEKRSVTLDEMKDLAQKSAGASAKFEEASKIRKDNEDAIRQYDLIQRMGDSNHTPTDAEINELAGMIGVDAKEFAEYMKDDEGQPDPTPGKETPATIDKKALAEALGIDPAELKAVIDHSHQRHVADARKEIRQISDLAVDKDEIFGKMVIGENKDDKEESIKEMVAEDVLRRIQDGGQFGAELVAASVQKIRAHLQKFGMPGKPDQYPLTLGLGPSAGLPAEVLSEKPIERKSAAEDGDESNFVARIMQKCIAARRSRG
jgi:hypothetical protein